MQSVWVHAMCVDYLREETKRGSVFEDIPKEAGELLPVIHMSREKRKHSMEAFS